MNKIFANALFLPVTWVLLFLLTVKIGKAEAPNRDWLWYGDIVSQSYSIEDTGMHGPVRFAFTLDDGLLVAGCWSGVFLFDGSHWQPAHGILRARTWLRRRDGRVMIGAAGAIYELKQNPRGVYDDLPVQKVANVETVLDYMTELEDGRLAALYGKGVMIEQADGSMKSFPLGTWSRGLVAIKSGVFLTVNNNYNHLCQLNPQTGEAKDIEDKFRDVFGLQHATDILPRDASTCWVITLDGHTYVFDGSTLTPAPWQQTKSPVLFVPTCILRYKDGTYVVGSVDEGVYFFSAQGEIIHRLNFTNGLPEASVVALGLDADDGLWVTTTRHVTRVDAFSRFLSFSEKHGLKVQDCESVIKHRGRIYIAGVEGLFEQNLDARDSTEAFRRKSGLQACCGLVSDGEVLWAGGNQLAGLQPDGTVKFYETGTVTGIVIPSENKNRLVCSTMDGFVILERSGREWQITKKISLGGPATFNLLELRPSEYWAECGTGRVARLRLKDGEPEVRLMGVAEGVPNFWTCLVVFEGNLYVGDDPHGVRRWDVLSQHFVVSDELSYYGGNPPWTFVPEFLDKQGNTWVLENVRSGVLVRKPSKIVGAPLQIAALGEAWLGRGTFVDSDGSTWICFVGGVLHCAKVVEPVRELRSRLLIREIRDISNGEMLAGIMWKGGRLELSPKQNSIRITAAFLDFRSCRYAKFKIWIEGLEKEPADWSQESDRELTKLPSGSYTLHLSGRDGIGLQSSALTLQLVIATPWYKTKLATVGYVAAGILLIVLLIRLREMRLRWLNRQLTKAIEEGRSELAGKHEELQKVFVRTDELARDLATANVALNQSTQAKTEFVRTLSHELRNPIAGARMMADLLSRSERDAVSSRQVSNLRNCVKYLQTLLDDTLDITQVESGHVAVKLEQFTPAALLQEVASIFENIAQEKRLKFEISPGPWPEQLLGGDKTHSKRILVNYLSNAFKFTTQGSVELRAEPVLQESDICRLRFEVRDTGPGISEALQGHIFSKFVRESSHGENDSMPGAGLGLALCKQLAELTGGTVGFSTKVGEGSVFWAELPFIALKQSERLKEEDTMDLRPDFSDVPVCVIDDDPLQLEAMASALEEFGVVPATAKTIKEALELFQAVSFQVVIVDYHLGRETGIQLLLKARGQSSLIDLSSTQFYLITSLWEEGLAEKAVAAGFRKAHKKPLSLVALFHLLQAARRD